MSGPDSSGDNPFPVRTTRLWVSGVDGILSAQGRWVTSAVQFITGTEALAQTYLLHQVLVCPHEYLLLLYPGRVLQETQGIYSLVPVLAEPPTPRIEKTTDMDRGCVTSLSSKALHPGKSNNMSMRSLSVPP